MLLPSRLGWTLIMHIHANFDIDDIFILRKFKSVKFP